ncbi:MAG TPA: hypothetical protein VN231_13075 [Allosphingosinicella sp.]|nr:hypothetical protein [Allosphingosinicella sp.]
MKAALLAGALSLAACGEGDPPQAGPANAAQIERLARPRATKQDPQASARLQPVTPEDLRREGLLGAGCNFSSEGRMLLAAVGSDAVARVEGELRHLVHSASVGPTGGFFEERRLSVSVGRTDDRGRAFGAATSWPARITATNRRTGAQQELPGLWTCGV